MKDPVLISQLHLYVINIIRKIRLELGLSQRDVSRILFPDSDNNLLGSIESNFRKEKYTDEGLHKLAKGFSIIDTNKVYTILDFYPESPLPEVLVSKFVIEIPDNISPTGTLNLLLEKKDTFFAESHTVKEITNYCNEFMKREWKTTDFTSVVARAEATEKLIRSGENDPKYKKA